MAAATTEHEFSNEPREMYIFLILTLITVSTEKDSCDNN